MTWLIAITASLVLGWGFTITRLLYDEWHVKRDSLSARTDAETIGLENRPGSASGWAEANPQGEEAMSIETNLSELKTVANGSDAGRTFFYPHQVVSDPNLSVAEKRAILSAWASDMHAVESLPALRHMPGTPFPVTFSAIMDALAQLDRLAGFGTEPDEIPPAPGAANIRRSCPAAELKAA